MHPHILLDRPQGSNQSIVISTGLEHVEGLAVDWVSRKLYWTNDASPKSTIEVAELDGSNRKILIYRGLNEPADIVVHPTAG